MRVEILIKFSNDSYAEFELKINQKTKELKIHYQILDIDILNDGKQIVAIIKYK
jgi:hypothetical protein